jgi:hypothetical protein
VGSTNKERVLECIWAASPGGATNAQIRHGTGITSHQQVYLLTRELAIPGWIRREQHGREWVFWADESVGSQLSSPGATRLEEPVAGPHASETFAERARAAMSLYLGVELAPNVIPGVLWAFDMVSPDQSMTGCALYYAPVQGQHLPPAKFSLIAERIWLLERAGARDRFLVFGYDRDVPLLWLERYGHLASGVGFFYLDGDGSVEELNSQGGNAE